MGQVRDSVGLVSLSNSSGFWGIRAVAVVWYPILERFRAGEMLAQCAELDQQVGGSVPLDRWSAGGWACPRQGGCHP